MKKHLLSSLLLAVALSSSMLFTACSNTDNIVPDIPGNHEVEKPKARITETIRKDEAKATVYNIEYPSVDPYGNVCMLSGSVIVGDELENDGKQARGMVLYNHFTVFQKEQCPTLGDLGVALKVVGSKLICVAPDYYGFGSTGDKNQAYCMSRTNAQNSVDCLLAARELLKEKGYTWGDFLFNLGYSEGGQTSMGVIRLCAEKYPDIKITHSICGAGPYDIGETYHQLVKAGTTSMPSTVISTALAFNEYYRLGLKNADMFKEPTLSNIPVYLLSKNYKRGDFEGTLASETISEWFQPAMLDFNSEPSKKIMEAQEKDNLSKGWKPRGNERISLIHNKLDACVPYSNTTKMAEFFKANGFTIDEGTTDNRYVDGKVFVYSINIPALSKTVGAHEVAALAFVTELITVITHYLEIAPWFTLTAEELQGV